MMVNRNGNKLNIFEDFVVDKKLPKHNKIVKEGDNSIDRGFIVGGSNESWGNLPSEDDEIDYAWQHIYERRRSEVFRNPTLKNKFRLWYCEFMASLSKKILVKELNRDKKVSVIYENTEKFFEKIKESFKEIENEDLKEVGVFYEKQIMQAKKLNQTSLVESLIDKFTLIEEEAKLINSGYVKYVSEEDIVKFNGVYGLKNLHLTWIKNFNRVIPTDIFELKEKADEVLIFDNYVILHTDATGDVVNETKAEKKARIEREKDPILFGVIKSSRKLYYIGDWVDEYCDLTLDKLLTTLSKDKSDTISPNTLKKTITDGKV